MCNYNRNKIILASSKNNVNVVKDWQNINMISKPIVKRIMEKSKIYLYASTPKNPNVVRFGYVLLHVCENLLGVLQLVGHLGVITIKEPKLLLDYSEN
jgi:hypothetical protein